MDNQHRMKEGASVRGSRPIKVAIVGGGCASVTAAFELSRPEHAGLYDVTVYQQGWRLGGKGASSRGVANRIEEHGIHLWMGHYDNAFHLMRQCYRELNRDPRTCPIADWTDAFVPDPYIGITNRSATGEWQRMMAHFPPMPGLPGDPYTQGFRPTIPEYLSRAARLLYTLLLAAQPRRQPNHGGDHGTNRSEDAPREQAAARPPGEMLIENVTRLLKYGQLATLTGLIQGAALLEASLAAFPAVPQSLASRLLDAVGTSAYGLLRPLLDHDSESRDLWEVIDVVLASLRGSIRSGLALDPRGFDAINEYDSREWLRLNGASDRSLNSGFVRGLYDLAFAYEDGDPTRPAMAAGQGLRGSFRMLFTYRGSLFWKMQAGMGEVVFAPFYEVLNRRGVRFEFFHRLENVALADVASLATGEKPYVERLDFDVQARVANGGPYAPLVDISGLPCWPAAPHWDQLEEGDRLRAEGREFESFWDRRCEAKKRLQVTEDFDFVVLGVSIGAIPHVCDEFIQRDSRWRAMVEHVKTVPTQCFQIWMREGMESLGWEEPPPNLSGFVEPFDTWADMSHLAAVEGWKLEPKAIAYFCNALAAGPSPGVSASGYPAEQRERVRRHAIDFLNREIVHLWPNAQAKPGTFRWDLLIDPCGSGDNAAADKERFDTQFWTANVNPSDRYVLSLPGTLKHRISPLDETYDNLTIAGDWTDCGFNFGCIEAAVMSGRLAAHALSRRPRLEEIFGYDHP
jgi:uncharacterized protein with NAD-binding domain and iron-sulfur cluster